MTGLGPLTTTLIPPPSCASSFANVYITTDPGGTGGFGGPVGTDRCFPSNYQDIRFYHYSPRICPSGHTTACWTSNVITSLTETTVACCLDFGLLYFYAPTYTGPPVIWKNSYRGCASAFSSLSADPTWASNGDTFTFTYNNSGDFNAFGVQVRFQSSDIAGVTSSSTTQSPSLTTTSTSTTSTTSSTPSRTSGGEGLNRGASCWDRSWRCSRGPSRRWRRSVYRPVREKREARAES